MNEAKKKEKFTLRNAYKKRDLTFYVMLSDSVTSNPFASREFLLTPQRDKKEIMLSIYKVTMQSIHFY